MRLSSISGLEGVLKDDDFVRVRDLARVARSRGEKRISEEG
jgi:hypothetical protein